jgi:DNA-directed RNA polymerase subunit M/transcription elongation factor TFIIS
LKRSKGEVKEEKPKDSPKITKSNSVSSPVTPRAHLNLEAKRKKAVDLLAERLSEKQGEGTTDFFPFRLNTLFLDEFDPVQIGQEIENELFKKFGDAASQPYKTKLLSLLSNLKSNADLRESIMKKFISASVLCSMTVQEMASDELKKRRKDIEDYYLEACQSVKPSQRETEMFKCSKCGSRKTSFFQLQTRRCESFL